ncbi:MAG: site-specific DNA-methyltransferase [Flavobacterium sp.]|nr:site-specific DNA-methyltransferase [Flavobacterium sp.]
MTDKLPLQSPNLVSQNIERIAALFPNCITETANGKAIDFDLLKQELNTDMVDGLKERYRLEWAGKREAIVTANLPTTKTLRPIVADSVDFDTTQNLYIEGDNLEVLKLLQESYLGKVKMIYIDPPYNTGNDFVYKDKFTQDKAEYEQENAIKDEYNQRLQTNPETSGRYHSDWLTMMYPRLKLARNLLTDDGVIFISIDDNEVHNLRKICDEVFGEGNFLGQWNWFKSATPPNLSKKIKKNIEYILAFQKGNNDEIFTGIKKTSSSDDGITKPQNTIKELLFPIGTINTTLENGIYQIGVYGTEKYPNELMNELIVENGKNANEVTFKNRFTWTQPKLNEELQNNTTINLSKNLVLSIKKADYRPEVPPNLIDKNVNVDTTENAGRDLHELLGGNKIFDYPKPISLIKYLLNFCDNKEAIILDFFSGSATTAHAVMQLNAEDGGNRNFIMVQVPEATDEKSEAFKAGYKNICEIGKERIRRAAKQIVNSQQLMDNSKKQELNFEDSTLNLKPQTLDLGFRVYRLDSSNMQDVYYKPQDYRQENLDLFASNIKTDRTPEDLLAQVMLSWGLPLHYKIETLSIQGKQVFKVAQDSLFACFDNGIDEAFAKEIATHQPLRIVFKDDSFTNDTAKENVKQLLKQLSANTEMKVI